MKKKQNKSKATPAAPDTVQRLVHELEVHQVELELQNEELRTARTELESALARYTELFDFAPVGYALLDARGDIERVNLCGAKLLARDLGSLERAPMRSFVDSRDLVAFDALLASTAAEDGEHTCEVRVRTSDGGPCWLRVTATALARHERIVLLAFADITQRKAERERLAAAEQALRQANQRKDEFLTILSHELRNPLAPIKNSLFVLSRAEPGSAYARNAQEIIERQVTHLTRLIDELLDMTRITRGKITLRREHLDIQALVQRTVEDHAAAFDARGIRLQMKTGPEPLWANIDPVRVVQVVSNLLSNASKFTPVGGAVVVTTSREQSFASVTVADTGAGIAPDMLPSLFEPFSQAPQAIDRDRGGLGLGLAMVKGIVELHGGEVTLTSEGHGRGTTVRFTIPLATGPAEAVAPASVPAGAPRRVLVIEDNPDTASSLRGALTLLGHEVVIAPDGRSGIALAREQRPDVVLCDIGLPGMSGYDVAATLRADAALRATLLVAVTGYAHADDVERATAAGYDRVLAKPTSVDALSRVLAETRKT